MSIDSIEQPLGASERNLREQTLAQLQGYIDRGETPDDEVVDLAARTLRRHTKTVRTWIRTGRLPERVPWLPDEEAVVDYYLGRGCVVDARSFMAARLGEENTLNVRTLQRGYAEALPPAFRAYVTEGYKGYFENTVVLTEPEGPLPRNFRWEEDWIDLKLRVLLPGHTRKLKAYLILLIDCSPSRLAMGVGLVVGRRPNRFDVLQTTYDGVCEVERIGPGYGCPIELRCDLGPEFVAADVADALRGLRNTRLVPTLPYTPWHKGRVERAQGTLKRKILAQVGGAINGARDKTGKLYAEDARGVPLDVLVEVVLDKVWAYNHTKLRKLGGKTRAEAWLADPTPIREIPTREAWLICQARKTSKVHRQGIAFNNTHYLDLENELNAAIGEELEFCYSQVNPDTIEVIRDGEWLCTAIDVRKLNPDQQHTIVEYRQAGLKEAGRLRAAAARRRRVHLSAYRGSNPAPPENEKALAAGADIPPNPPVRVAGMPAANPIEELLRAKYDNAA